MITFVTSTGSNIHPTSNHTGSLNPAASILNGKQRLPRGHIHQKSKERSATRHQAQDARKEAAAAAKCSPNKSKNGQLQVKHKRHNMHNKRRSRTNCCTRQLGTSCGILKLRSIRRSYNFPSTRSFDRTPSYDPARHLCVRIIESLPPGAVAITT